MYTDNKPTSKRKHKRETYLASAGPHVLVSPQTHTHTRTTTPPSNKSTNTTDLASADLHVLAVQAHDGALEVVLAAAVIDLGDHNAVHLARNHIADKVGGARAVEEDVGARDDETVGVSERRGKSVQMFSEGEKSTQNERKR